MQYACAILSSVACPALQYFSTFLINPTILNQKKSYWTQKVCFDFLYKFCLKHFSLLEEFNEMRLKKYSSLHIKYPLFLSDLSETWIFSTYLWNILKYQISWKSIHWEPMCIMRTDGRTAMAKLIVAFRNAPNNTSTAQMCNIIKMKIVWMDELGTRQTKCSAVTY
jgi:hypothetical protein